MRFERLKPQEGQNQEGGLSEYLRKKIKFLETGLVNSDDLERTFEMINGPIRITSSKPGDLDLFFEGGSFEGLSSDEYYEYVSEFAEDLNDFQLRLQRLKMRVSLDYLSGLYRQKAENVFNEKLENLAVVLYQYEEFTPEKMASLISEFNRHVPDEAKLEFNENYTKYDAKILHDVIMKMFTGDLVNGSGKIELSRLLADINEIESILSKQGSQAELFSSAHDNKSINEEGLRVAWNQYRMLLKRFSTYQESESWFSPTYGESVLGQKGRNQYSTPFAYDYQRVKMREIEQLQSEFSKQRSFARPTSCVLVNSGMNGLHLIFLYLNQILDQDFKDGRKPTVFKMGDIYFEVDAAIQDNFKRYDVEPKVFNPEQTMDFVDAIKAELPDVVFMNPMSNGYDMKITEVSGVLEALVSDDDWRKSLEGKDIRPVYIVVDNSTLGFLANWRNFSFEKLPPFIKVISFESLVKYSQDGMELTQAGLITFMNGDQKKFRDKLSSLRFKAGLMPPENTVRKMSNFIPADLNERKMKRHSRNTLFIANALSESIEKTSGGIIAEVKLPSLDSHPQHEQAEKEMLGSGALLNLGFDLSFIDQYAGEELNNSNSEMDPNKNIYTEWSLKISSAFLNLIIKMAKELQFELNLGTSYGFNTSRMAAYTRSTEIRGHKVNLKYIRMALGTENIKDIKILLAIIERVNQIFSQAIQEGRLNDLIKASSSSQGASIAFNKRLPL